MLVYEAGEISTKLLKKRPSLTVITTDKATKVAFKNMGKEIKINGPLIHEILFSLTVLVPLKFIQGMLLKTGKSVLQKVREKEAAESLKKTQ